MSAGFPGEVVATQSLRSLAFLARAHAADEPAPRPSLLENRLDFGRLNRWIAQQVFVQMRRVAAHLLTVPLCLDCLCRILFSTPTEFKRKSTQGALWHLGRWRDAGNYACSVLWNTMLAQARPGNVALLLPRRWPSLAASCPPSRRSLVKKGDVIQFVLAETYDAGLAAPRRQEKLELSRLINSFVVSLTELHRTLADGGPVPYTHWPSPEVVSLWCLSDFV